MKTESSQNETNGPTEEESSTLSWTSSLQSLSPDNPLFQASKTNDPSTKEAGSKHRQTGYPDTLGDTRLLAPEEVQVTDQEHHPLLRNQSSSSSNEEKFFLEDFDEPENPTVASSIHMDPQSLHGSESSLLGKRLHHERMPSTILETTEANEETMTELSTAGTSVEEYLPPSGGSPLRRTKKTASQSNMTSPARNTNNDAPKFEPVFQSTAIFQSLSKTLLKKYYTPFAAATWIGFWALLHVTCANYVLTPIRDAIALQVGVKHMPKLTLASTLLAFCSSVPIGWLFEAPDPSRRRLWKRMGLTRGETQGSSLALFYRCFALTLVLYAAAFQTIEWLVEKNVPDEVPPVLAEATSSLWPDMNSLWALLGQFLYIAFFLVVHLMKLHSLSLVWGVTTEAMEYEEVARKRSQMESNRTRIQRLALVGFGGTLGGILGSGLASSMARILRLPGLLVLAAVLLEISAELSIELGRIMQKHWEEQQLFQSTNDLASLDPSMKRSASVGSMKRVASGNSINRVRSTGDISGSAPGRSPSRKPDEAILNEDSFFQRLLRGLSTILKSRLLMAIFTYNALYASTTVLLSFQRAALVAERNDNVEQDTAFLANVNMASSVAIFLLQASGIGAALAHVCGPQGTLSLMPFVRLAGVLALAWWHRFSGGRPPNLMIFLMVDELCKVMNLAVAKPVRESLWRGLSNEARYEAKPIVDTLANRWGGGSAAFLVSFLSRALELFGLPEDRLLGLPPMLFLCMTISAWWCVVSADLGQIRKRIDLELKKIQ